MRVEITESILMDGMEKRIQGDRVTVTDEKGAIWVGMGWAVNLETGEKNSRQLTPKVINPSEIKAAK